MSTTRSHTIAQRRHPPLIRRTSAICIVKFTAEGRVMARRMMMPACDAAMAYHFTTHEGVTTHHFFTSEGPFSIEGGLCPAVENVNTHHEIVTTASVP